MSGEIDVHKGLDLQHRRIEDAKCGHDHLVMLIDDRLADERFKLTIVQYLVDPQTQVA